MKTLTGIELIDNEQQRVRGFEGFTPTHDLDHTAGQLLGAAGCYIAKVMENIANATGCMEEEVNSRMQVLDSDGNWIDAWPFEKDADKRTKHDNIKLLVQAGQMIASEIDRLQNS